MPKPIKDPPVRVIRVKKGDSLKMIYAKARKAFTAADLQRFTETEEGIHARQVLAELDAMTKEHEQRQKPKLKKKGQTQR